MPDLTGCRVLVVEDDYMIADDVVDVLRSAGAMPVGPVGWEEEGLAIAADLTAELDLAILDVDLHGTSSSRIADALAARGVPIIVTTGFNADALGPEYGHYPRLEKPVSERALLAAIRLLP